MLMVRVVMGATVPVRAMVVLTVFHHPHHLEAAGPEKYDHQDDEGDNHDGAADELSGGELPGNQHPHQHAKHRDGHPQHMTEGSDNLHGNLLSGNFYISGARL